MTSQLQSKIPPQTQVKIQPTKKSNEPPLCLKVFFVLYILGIIGMVGYCFITSIIACVEFSHSDVKEICPESEIWYWVLFIGIIIPAIQIFNTTKEKDENFNPIVSIICHIIIWIIFIIWGADQLWGLDGFANDSCAYDNWGHLNVTDDGTVMNKEGNYLYNAVLHWIIAYGIIIGSMFLFCLCGGGYLCIESIKAEQKQTPPCHESETNDVNIIKIEYGGAGNGGADNV